ncbi:hypothetical protein PV08_11635 [Exophiala spinifera]|uniref:Zn(2)-C6 fungal-type domain-containing protein n=1 Tax=Exophiala spinifera TaxID=91928 RepID=A0A0D1Y706_9EURO|nr:uncharacterized protein PV08_11635 [Exophiala spinifera]KIW10671.1 hypothetical protein PV08_11635 [Exophiala spinifera]
MGKVRQRHTCTECSSRRQKCDRRLPCGRCVKRGIPDKCQLEWSGRRYQKPTSPEPHSRPTPPRDRVDDVSPDPGMLPSVARHATDTGPFADGEGWDLSRSNTQRPRYDFAPYALPQLRKKTADVDDMGATPLFFSSTGSGCGPHLTAAAHEAFLQMLLPSLSHIWKLVDFHEAYLLWYHCCYHGPTFRAELESVIAEQEDKTSLNVGGLHLQWLALLFSIMAASLTCSSERRLKEWGFSKSEAATLSMQWYKAAITSLNQGEWMLNHDIYSVQAVTTLTMSAHPLGRSTELSILLGAAVKVAQALSLDKLDYDASLETIDATSSPEQRHRLIQCELGRKLWSQLCVQDWTSLPFAGSHNINPSHFTTTLPSKRDYLTMESLPTTFPTYISYGNYLFDIAKLVVRHHEATLQATTPFTEYQSILDYDTRMRNLATKGMPRYFHVVEPVDTLWPEWVHWARSSLTVCFAHKIIMIHRAYIRQSFANPMYSMTRATCTAAAKTILNEAKKAKDIDGPIIWIDKAFCVAAAIILCLDILHRPDSDPELAIHRGLVLECVEQLQRFENSIIAARGATVLTEILAQRDRASASAATGWPTQGIDTVELINAVSSTVAEPLDASRLESRWSAELFPPQMGFSNKFLFESLLGHKAPDE